MNKKEENKVELIRETTKDLPFFSIEDLALLKIKPDSLRILIHRLIQNEKIISLKRGWYVNQVFLDSIKAGTDFNSYLEFLGNTIYKPSYLSAEYVLDKHGVVSESVQAFVLVTRKKTNRFSNQFGVFKYHNIKKELFCGFKIIEKNLFTIAEASLAKALFDFLYFRKDILFELAQIKALRLNLGVLTKKDWKEFKKYIELEGSKRMSIIFNFLKHE